MTENPINKVEGLYLRDSLTEMTLRKKEDILKDSVDQLEKREKELQDSIDCMIVEVDEWECCTKRRIQDINRQIYIADETLDDKQKRIGEIDKRIRESDSLADMIHREVDKRIQDRNGITEDKNIDHIIKELDKYESSHKFGRFCCWIKKKFKRRV